MYCVSEWTNFETHFQKLAPFKIQYCLKNLGVLGVILEAWRQPGAPKRSPETPREHTRAPSRPATPRNHRERPYVVGGGPRGGGSATRVAEAPPGPTPEHAERRRRMKALQPEIQEGKNPEHTPLPCYAGSADIPLRPLRHPHPQTHHFY